MKQNVSEKVIDMMWLAFLKKCKNMSTKQEIVSDAAFKAWPFSSDFNFACKDGWVTTTTCKYYFPLVINLTITSDVVEFLDPSLKMSPFTKTSPVLCENQSFFLSLEALHLYRKSFCFSCTFYSMMIYFWSAF